MKIYFRLRVLNDVSLTYKKNFIFAFIVLMCLSRSFNMRLYSFIIVLKIIDAYSASNIPLFEGEGHLAIAAADIVDKCFGSSDRWSELLMIPDQASRDIIKKIYHESRTSNSIVFLGSFEDNCYSNISTKWQEINPTAIVITTHSSKQLKSVLDFLKNDIHRMWKPESYFFIVLETDCDPAKSNNIFKAIWDNWILNAVILCSSNDPANSDQSGIELYTFNPYSGDHSQKWKTIIQETVEVSINTGNFNHSWYIFKQRFNRIMSFEDCGDIFFDKTLNLDGYVIPMSFSYPEFLSDTTEFYIAKLFAADSRTLKSISTKLRFDVVQVFNYGLNAYGELHENGSYSGMMSDIHKGLSYLGPTMRGMNLYPNLGMTYPHDESSGCFVSRIVGIRPQWTNLVVARNIWISVGLGTLLSTVVLYLQNKSHGVVSAFLEALRLIIGNSIIHTSAILKHRIILGSIFLVVLVIDGTIRGRFISILTVARPYPNLDTVKQLIEQNVDVYANDIIINQFLEFPLKSRLNNTLSSKECFKTLERSEHRQFACFGNCLELKFMTANSSVIHISSDPIWRKYVTYLTTINWPMANRYSFEVQKLVEAGIFNKWKSDINRNVEVDGWKRNRAAELPYVRSTKLNDLLPAFMLLFIGLSIALIAFVCEIISYKYLS